VKSPFDINCASSVSYNNIGERVIHYTVTGTTFRFLASAQKQNVTIDSASWQSTEQGCGRGIGTWYQHDNCRGLIEHQEGLFVAV
jgi:hypothetical protein